MSEMLKFQQLINEVRPFGMALTDRQIGTLTERFERSDVVDLVRWLDHLADEKAELPEWDGDSSDDISRAQLDLARLLVGLRGRFGEAVETALSTANEDTIRWVQVAEDKMSLRQTLWQKWLRRLVGRRS